MCSKRVVFRRNNVDNIINNCVCGPQSALPEYKGCLALSVTLRLRLLVSNSADHSIISRMSDHMGHPGNGICCKCLDEDESDLQLKSFWHLSLSGFRVFEGRSANKYSNFVKSTG